MACSKRRHCEAGQRLDQRGARVRSGEPPRLL